MRAVVAVKSNGGKGGGASRAARYISERDRGPEREGARPRPLFSDRDGDLTYRKANRFLGNGQGAPGKDDLIHFSVSFLPEDYERLGANGTERIERLREVAREAMEDVKSDLHAEDLRWVAGIHLNTDHPHLHILVHKEITVREEGESRRLGRLPKRLLPHRAPAPDGEARPVEGSIGERFVAALDRAQQRVDLERERDTDFHKEAPETDEERRVISGFLKAYVDERLKDPETRALNRSASFRQAHEQIVAATTPEELNRVAESFLRQNLERSTALRNGQSPKPNEMPLNARERHLLFFGRAPEHHTAEMRELRHAWGLSRAERAEQVAAIGEGRLEPSPTLAKMLAELESRRSVPALRHYQASILNEEMRNPGRVNLRQLYERLSPYERTYLVEQIERRKQSLTQSHAPAREPAKETSDHRVYPPHGSESYRDYMTGVEEIEQRLLNEAVQQRQKSEGRFGDEGTVLSTEEARALLPTEEQTGTRNRACNLAWERVAPPP